MSGGVSEEPEIDVTHKATPLPKRKFVAVCLLSFNEAFQSYIFWPFLPFLVEDFLRPGGRDTDNLHTALFVGILGSSYFGARFLTAGLWGWLSDKLGRRSTLLAGLLFTALSILGFGLSQTYGVAVAMLAISGALNGNTGIIKSYVGEMTDASNQARAFSYVAFFWSLGEIIAPSLGGYLAQPRETLGYLRPCIAASGLAVVGFVLGLLLLPESDGWRLIHYKERAPFSAEEHREGVSMDSQADGVQPREYERCRCPVMRWLCPCFAGDLPDQLKESSVTLTILLAALFSMVRIMFDELLPVFCETQIEDGGMSFSSSQIGLFMSIHAIGLLGFQLLAYPLLASYFGPTRLLQSALLLLVPYLVLFPTITHLTAAPPAAMWGSLALVQSVKVSFICMGMISCYVLVNNSAPPEDSGIVNGWGHAMVSLARACGPVIAGGVFSSSMKLSETFWLHSYLTYVMMAIISLVGFFVALKVPLGLDLPFIERHGGESKANMVLFSHDASAHFWTGSAASFTTYRGLWGVDDSAPFGRQRSRSRARFEKGEILDPARASR